MLKAAMDSVIVAAPPGIGSGRQTPAQLVRRRRGQQWNRKESARRLLLANLQNKNRNMPNLQMQESWNSE